LADAGSPQLIKHFIFNKPLAEINTDCRFGFFFGMEKIQYFAEKTFPVHKS